MSLASYAADLVRQNGGRREEILDEDSLSRETVGVHSTIVELGISVGSKCMLSTSLPDIGSQADEHAKANVGKHLSLRVL